MVGGHDIGQYVGKSNGFSVLSELSKDGKSSFPCVWNFTTRAGFSR